jgi:hypothetical protein
VVRIRLKAGEKRPPRNGGHVLTFTCQKCALATYGDGDSQHCVPGNCTPQIDISGWTGGGALGFNWQVSNLVVGIEGTVLGARSTDALSQVLALVADLARARLKWVRSIRSAGD